MYTRGNMEKCRGHPYLVVGAGLTNTQARGERMSWEGQALQQQRDKRKVKFSATAMQKGGRCHSSTSALPGAGWDPTAWLTALTVLSGQAKDVHTEEPNSSPAGFAGLQQSCATEEFGFCASGCRGAISAGP